MAVSLTVLGTSSPFPVGGRACPGYIVQTEKAKILIECGSGVIARLGGENDMCGAEDLDAVIVSHLHGDHMSDLLVLKYGIDRAISKGHRKMPLVVYGPSEPMELARLIHYHESVKYVAIDETGGLDEEGKPGGNVTLTWNSHSAEDNTGQSGAGSPLKIGDIDITFYKVEHPIPTLAMRFHTQDIVIAYSADSGPCRALEEVAQKANLFLCEATLLDTDTGPAPGHLTARQAGELAARAGVKSLLLTHFQPGYSAEHIIAEARKTFPNSAIAKELYTYRSPFES